MAGNSDIAQAFADKKRVRTMNHRGSLLVSTPNVTGLPFASTGIVSIIPIPFAASIKSISLGVGTAMSAASYSIGMGGINQNGSITEIDVALFRADTVTPGTGNTWVELLVPSLTNKTIYEQLCTGNNKLPKVAFQPYQNDRYGMLIFKVETVGTAGITAANPVIVKVSYVEGSPSESPLTDLTINPRATPIA
jgi:hypothetical protein